MNTEWFDVMQQNMKMSRDLGGRPLQRSLPACLRACVPANRFRLAICTSPILFAHQIFNPLQIDRLSLTPSLGGAKQIEDAIVQRYNKYLPHWLNRCKYILFERL